MTRQRLTPEQVGDLIRASTGQKPRRHPDGQNLYLVTRNGRGFWVCQYWQPNGMGGGKVRSHGLGACPPTTPAQARKSHEAFRVGLRHGIVPSRTRLTVVVAGKSFGEVVAEFINAKSSGWKGDHEAKQFRRLEKLDLAKIDIGVVDTPHVLAALSEFPPDTAERMRNRIEQVLSYATALKYRSGENPARLRGHLEHILPTDNGGEEKHLAALPYKQVPATMRKLGDDVKSRAVAFTILTASRRGSVVSATWSEVEGDLWNVPADHMKGGKAHFVPLTPAALKLLGKRGAPDALLFPEASAQAVSDTFTALAPDYTLHGCRSSFRDWAREQDFPNDIAEMCLAHSVGTKVEKAYKRSELIAKRRALLSAWSDFATGAAHGQV